MSRAISGIHHITAIAGAPQDNLDFYVRSLGLRLVKQTVNFDDPGTYHFYFGDRLGRPGTILTFFPWPHAVRGTGGAGMAQDTLFSVPLGALPFWVHRFQEMGLPFQGPAQHLGQSCLFLEDPDGLSLQLVESDDIAGNTATVRHDIPPDVAIQGFHGVSLAVENRSGTVRFLTEVFGLEPAVEEESVVRFRSAGDGPGRFVDVVTQAGRGRLGSGTVHHVAFRAADDAEQQAWQDRLMEAGFHPTDVRDRNYFRSIYFREPGGVLFEIATDLPGFATDEPPESLGTHLKLPPWLETHRDRIQTQLPQISLP